MKIFILLSLFNIVNSLDVIGWFVGDNKKVFDLDKIRYDLYSHIRIGSIKVDKNGYANCANNLEMNQAIQLINKNKTKININSEVDIEKCAFNNISSTYCTNYFNTLKTAIIDCGPKISGIEFDYEWGLHTNIFR